MGGGGAACPKPKPQTPAPFPKKWGDHPCSHYHPKAKERKASDINSAPLPLILPAPLNSLPSPFALPPSLSKGGLAQSLNPKARHPDHEVPLPQTQQRKKKKKK